MKLLQLTNLYFPTSAGNKCIHLVRKCSIQCFLKPAPGSDTAHLCLVNSCIRSYTVTDQYHSTSCPVLTERFCGLIFLCEMRAL